MCQRPHAFTMPTRGGMRGRDLLAPEFGMKTFVASINGTAALAFRAKDDDQARVMVDDHEGDVRSDLHVLIGPDGSPLWDGESPIHVQEATAAQHSEWQQSRDQAISDGDIDLDAGDNPYEWKVYFVG